MVFDPAAPVPADAGLFGLSTSERESLVHILPVPFDATASYGEGSARAPAAIRVASHQLDYYDRVMGRPYLRGICMLPLSRRVQDLNRRARQAVKTARTARGKKGGSATPAQVARVDRAGADLNRWVEERVGGSLDREHVVGVLGGEHSVSLGSIRAHARRFPEMGVLVIDAHHDLRPAYEGFTWSHASVFHHVVQDIPAVKRIVQVGVRDFAEEEAERVRRSRRRVVCFYDRDLARSQENGTRFRTLAARIVRALPPHVYLSVDIDGLCPHLCPSTGTPAPGGLEYNQLLGLLEEIVRSGRRVVGFDLVEVTPGPTEWDANVGARVLYQLVGHTLLSCGETKAPPGSPLR